MEDKLISKFRDIIPDEKQLKSLIDCVDNTPNFEFFLKEDEENIKQTAEKFLKIRAEHEQEISQLNKQIERLKYMVNISNGFNGTLEVSSEKVKVIDNWLNAVEIGDLEAVVESTGAAAMAIKAIVISGEAFKEKKRGKGRPPKEYGDGNESIVWAFSACYGVSAAAMEFNKSESLIKKIRNKFEFNQYLSNEQIDSLAKEIAKGYELQKSKK